tara:strand:+ start:2613 stop:3383 length:771 start_codon:yes stop_codon:yes gene_type:complete
MALRQLTLEHDLVETRNSVTALERTAEARRTADRIEAEAQRNAESIKEKAQKEAKETVMNAKRAASELAPDTKAETDQAIITVPTEDWGTIEIPLNFQEVKKTNRGTETTYTFYGKMTETAPIEVYHSWLSVKRLNRDVKINLIDGLEGLYFVRHDSETDDYHSEYRDDDTPKMFTKFIKAELDTDEVNVRLTIDVEMNDDENRNILRIWETWEGHEDNENDPIEYMLYKARGGTITNVELIIERRNEPPGKEMRK